MAQPPAQFFSPWAPAPAFAGGPADPALEQRVAKLAEFAAKNGPAFVDMIRQKQAANPEYAFLVGGPGADYFSWRLYCHLHDLQPDRPLSLAPGQPAPHQAQQRGAAPAPTAAQPSEPQLPPEVDASFAAVLARLSGTRASIKESKEWFLAHARFADGLAARMLAHQQQLRGYEQQLHVIYLANDVLLKSLPDREQRQDAVLRAFQGPLPAMFHAACAAGGSAPEVQERLGTIADNWQARGVFSPAFIAELKHAMLHGPAPAQPPQQQRAPPEQPPTGSGQPPPQMHMQAPPQPYQQVQQHSQPFQQPPPQQWALPPQPLPGGMPLGAAPAWSQPPPQPQLPLQHAPMLHHAPLPQPQPQPGPPAHHGPPLQQPFMPRVDPHGWQAPLPGSMQSQPPFAMPPQLQPQPMPQHAHPVPGSVPPGAWGLPVAGPAPPPGAPPAGPPPAAAPPAKEPVDPMSFPPGLLPGLVLEQLRTEEPYAPLEERDVAAAPTPAGGEPGPRLQARLAKFYAELQDYRPGSSRADLEEALRRSRQQQPGPGPVPQPAASDGSFRGERPGGGGPAGLGFAAAPGGPEDPYSAYRKQRSGAYYETLGRMLAANQTQSQPAG